MSLILGIMILSGGQAKADIDVSRSVTDGTTPPGMAPGSPAGTYALSGFDHVNVHSGRLHLALPLMTLGRGGAKMTMYLNIDKQSWRVKDREIFSPGCDDYMECHYIESYLDYEVTDKKHWNLEPGYGPGVLIGRRSWREVRQCPNNPDVFDRTMTRLTFVTSDGTEVEFRDKATDGVMYEISACPGTQYNRGKTFLSTDGSSMTFISDDDIYDIRDLTDWDTTNEDGIFCPTGDLWMRDGSRYRIVNGMVQWIRDRNGNVLQFQYTSNWLGQVSKITDALNREVNIVYADINLGRYYDQISFSGYGGATRSIYVNHQNLSSVLRSGYSVAYTNVLFPFPQIGYYLYNPWLVSSLVLPDNRLYTFQYNNYGELARVTLPTGGAYEYDYWSGNEPDTYHHASGAIGPSGFPVGIPYHVYRRLQQRREYPAGGTGNSYSNRIDYGRVSSSTWDSAASTLTVWEEQRDPSNNWLGRTKRVFYGNPSPDYSFRWKTGKEKQTEVYSAALVKWRTTINDWRPGGILGMPGCTWCILPSGPNEAPTGALEPDEAYNPYLKETVTTLEDHTSRLTSKTAYEYDYYNNHTKVKEYGYGNGTPGVPGSLVREKRIYYSTTINSLDYAGTAIGDTTNRDSIIHLRETKTLEEVRDAAGTLQSQTGYEYDNYSTAAYHQPLLYRANLSGHLAAFGTGYTPRGNVTQKAWWLNAEGGRWISVYQWFDIAGNVVRFIDGKGNATLYDFSDRYGTPNNEARSNTAPALLGGLSSFAFPTMITNARNHVVYRQYDYYTGQMVNFEDANGTIGSMEYNDALDRPTRQIRGYTNAGFTNTSLVTYTALSPGYQVTLTHDQNGYDDQLRKGATVYDGLGRLSENRQYTTDSAYMATKTEYEAKGRLWRVSTPYLSGSSPSVWTLYEGYDTLDRPTSITVPGSGATSYSYSGNETLMTDSMSKAKRQWTDALWRMTQVREDPSGLAYNTYYGYDVLDNLTSVSQGAQTRTFTYDSLSQLRSAANPESGTTAYSLYDNVGNLLRKTDARGVQTDYAYSDALNRITGKTYSDGTGAVTYVYDGTWKGKLQYVLNANSRTDYLAYDALGRATQSRQTMFGRSYDVFYSYDLTGALTAETYPSGRVIATGYDRAGRSLQVQGTGIVYAQNVAFSPHGAATSRLMANGALQETMSYTGGLQLGSKLLQKVTPLTTHWQQQLYYNTNGNVQYQTLQPLGVNQFYYYDTLNRLYYEEEPSGTYVYRQYGFDAYGNRWVQGYAGVPLDVYTPTSQTQINAANNRLVMAGVNFDTAGNQTQIRGYAATYDAENRMRTVGTPSGTVTSDYDGEGRRVRKTSGVEAVYFVYDIFGRVIAEYGGQVAVTGRKFLTTDHLGSTRVVTNASGDVVSRHDYLAYGEEYPLINGRTTAMGYQPTIKERKQFTGKERDQESGLDNFLARFYAPILGRFTSPDPLMASGRSINPQTWNRYSYTLNNPLRYVDPLGLYDSPNYYCSVNGVACLNDDQRRILENSRIKINGVILSGESLYNELGVEKQNSFVNQTDTLSSLTLSDGNKVIIYVKSVTSVEGDRIKTIVSPGFDTQLAKDSQFSQENASLHKPYNDISYKYNVGRGNIQFSFDKGRTGVDIDHDLYRDRLLHIFGEVVPNHIGRIFGNQKSMTNQDKVRQMLISDPKITITPSPDVKFNR